jgi:hypothetical protein
MGKQAKRESGRRWVRAKREVQISATMAKHWKSFRITLQQGEPLESLGRVSQSNLLSNNHTASV